jgi:hypothetical protein
MSERYPVRLDYPTSKEEKQQLQHTASANGEDVSTLVRRIINDFLPSEIKKANNVVDEQVIDYERKNQENSSENTN